jgi:Histidine-specific methyltransferase, SAM-dependent
MEIAGVIRRLLVATAIQNNVEPSARAIYSLLTGSKKWRDNELTASRPAKFRSHITEHQLRTWLNGTVKGGPTVPRQVALLGFINEFLFPDAPDKHLTTFDVEYDALPISARLRRGVQDVIDAVPSKDPFKTSPDYVFLAPDYEEFDPSAIEDLARHTDLLPSHLLYQSPASAALWDVVKNSKQYRDLYNCCEKGLQRILKSSAWIEASKDLRLVYSLGAGSSDKDEIIIDWLHSNGVDAQFALVDASPYMLMRTIKNIDPSRYKGIGIAGMQLDFSRPARMRAMCAKVYKDARLFSEKKAFFVLGFTLSNLAEDDFFRSYAQVCSRDDLFIFPLQLIPEDYGVKERAAFMESLRHSYTFPEGMKLSRAGLSVLQNYTFKNPVHVGPTNFDFNNTNRSIMVQFRFELEDTDGASKQFTTARSTRHYRADYETFLASHNFEVLDRVPLDNNVETWLVRFMGKPAASGHHAGRTQ